MKISTLIVFLSTFYYSFSQIYVNETFPSIGAWTTSGQGSSDGALLPHQLWLHDFDGSNGVYWGGMHNLITSPTVVNGFMILDADFFNSPPSVPLPTFHASLHSPVYDLSANTNVELRFHHSYRTCCGNDPLLFVDITTDGFANLTTIPVDLTNAPTNVVSGTVEHVISLTNHIQGNPSNVQIGFRWGISNGGNQNNSHYYWMIDDVIIQATPLHEQKLETSELSTNLYSSFYGDEIAYSKIPLSQIVPMKAEGLILNHGLTDEAGTAFNTLIWDGGMNQIYNQSSTGQLNLSFDSVLTENLWTPNTAPDSYKILNQLDYGNVGLDNDPSDNFSDTSYLEISEFEYARDEVERDTSLNTYNGYITSQAVYTAPGNIFYFGQDDTLHSVKFAAMDVPQMHNLPVSVFVVKDPGDTNETLITQDSIVSTIQASELNSSFGSVVWKNIFINGGLPLEGGHEYYIGVKVDQSGYSHFTNFLVSSVTNIKNSVLAYQNASGEVHFQYNGINSPCPAVRAITKGYIEIGNVSTTIPTSCGSCDGQISVIANSLTGSPLSYQWYLDGNIMVGETSNILNNACFGSYELVISHPSGAEVIESVNLTAANQMVPEICLVALDSITNYNKVIWEKPISSAIDSFYIYKDTTQLDYYSRIGATAYSDLAIWIDPGSDPTQQSYRYKISLLDTCGIESNLSDYHQTFHLVAIQDTILNRMNLYWTNYSGIYYDSIQIYRGTSPNNLTLDTTIASVPNNYSDFNPPGGPVYYQIVVFLSNPCDPTKAGYQVIRSNISEFGYAGITENDIPTKIRIFPNPSKGIFNVEHSGEGKMEVYDYTGRMILNFYSEGKTEIDLSQYDSGVYLVRLGNETYRIIKE